jgi:predicted DNA-binding transcriptional regulator YafY
MMRRADRLMQLVQILRDGSLHRAQDLAQALDVSLRTIYRDMETLAASGVPVSGERGIGYVVTAAVTLPPLNLTTTQAEALHLGLSAVTNADDPELAQAAQQLLAMLDAVMPETPAQAKGQFAIYPFAEAARGFQHLPRLRQAIRTRQKLELTAQASTQTVRPLQLDYWGRLWTCVVWCEKRRDFDVIRVDQITALRLLPSLFVDEAGKSYADFTRIRRARAQPALRGS